MFGLKTTKRTNQSGPEQFSLRVQLIQEKPKSPVYFLKRTSIVNARLLRLSFSFCALNKWGLRVFKMVYVFFGPFSLIWVHQPFSFGVIIAQSRFPSLHEFASVLAVFNDSSYAFQSNMHSVFIHVDPGRLVPDALWQFCFISQREFRPVVLPIDRMHNRLINMCVSAVPAVSHLSRPFSPISTTSCFLPFVIL